MGMIIPDTTLQETDRTFLTKHCGLSDLQVNQLAELLPAFVAMQNHHRTAIPPAKALDQLDRLGNDLSRLKIRLRELEAGGSAAVALMETSLRLKIAPFADWPDVIGQMSRAVAVASITHPEPKRGRPEDKARLWLSDGCVERFVEWGLEVKTGESSPISMTLKILLATANEPADDVRSLIQKSIDHVCN